MDSNEVLSVQVILRRTHLAVSFWRSRSEECLRVLSSATRHLNAAVCEHAHPADSPTRWWIRSFVCFLLKSRREAAYVTGLAHQTCHSSAPNWEKELQSVRAISNRPADLIPPCWISYCPMQSSCAGI